MNAHVCADDKACKTATTQQQSQKPVEMLGIMNDSETIKSSFISFPFLRADERRFETI